MGVHTGGGWAIPDYRSVCSKKTILKHSLKKPTTTPCPQTTKTTTTRKEDKEVCIQKTLSTTAWKKKKNAQGKLVEKPVSSLSWGKKCEGLNLCSCSRTQLQFCCRPAAVGGVLCCAMQRKSCFPFAFILRFGVRSFCCPLPSGQP